MHGPFPKFSAVERSESLRFASPRNSACVRCNPERHNHGRYLQFPSCRRPSPQRLPQRDRPTWSLALDTAIPEALGAVAEKTAGQTREAYDRSKDALEASIATFERSFDAAGWGAAAFNRKIIDIARRNLNSSFDLATSLAGARNLAEIVELQAAYWRKQFSALTAQAEEVPALSTKVVADAGEPLKGHLMNHG